MASSASEGRIIGQQGSRNDPMTLQVRFEEIIRSYSTVYDAYISVIFNQAIADFAISEADKRKYELRKNGQKVPNSAKIFDALDVKDGDVVDLVRKT
jgi:hypothetical protein